MSKHFATLKLDAGCNKIKCSCLATGFIAKIAALPDWWSIRISTTYVGFVDGDRMWSLSPKKDFFK